MSAYIQAQLKARAAAGEMSDAALRRTRKALSTWADDMAKQIANLPPGSQRLALEEARKIINAQSSRLGSILIQTTSEMRDVTFKEVHGVWQLAAERMAAIENMPNALLGRVRTPNLTLQGVYEAMGGDGGPASTWKTLLKGHVVNASEEVNSLVSTALMKGSSPMELSKALRGYVKGSDDLKTFAQKAGVEIDPSDLRGLSPAARKAAKKMRYNADRIAFSEIHNARAEAELQHFAADPLIDAIRWTLAPNRGTAVLPCVCDALAGNDFYGLGKGVYPLDAVPFPPHPFDRCERVPVIREVETLADWHKPKPLGRTRQVGPDNAKIAFGMQAPSLKHAQRIRDNLTRLFEQTAKKGPGGMIHATNAYQPKMPIVSGAGDSVALPGKGAIVKATDAEIDAAVKRAESLTTKHDGMKDRIPMSKIFPVGTFDEKAFAKTFGEVIEIDMADVRWARQGSVSGSSVKDRLQTYNKNTAWEAPTVGRVGNTYVLEDGHHRAVVESMLGRKTLKVRVLDPAGAQPTAVPTVASGAPGLSGDVAFGSKIGGQLGSNEGAMWLGKDGVKRYIKTYKVDAQAHSENIANAIYTRLGLGAPKSTTFSHGGKLWYASEIIDGVGDASTLGKLGLTAQRAEKALDGFAADVLTANWDAAGLTIDNMVEVGGKIYRIDNGSAFLFRAQGTRKTQSVLDAITEWDTFNSPTNPSYRKLFQAAGLQHADDLGARAIKQIDDILDLRKNLGPGGWGEFIDGISPGLNAKDRAATIAMLDKRVSWLQVKRAELVKKLPAPAPVAPTVAPPAPLNPLSVPSKPISIGKLTPEQKKQGSLFSQKVGKTNGKYDPVKYKAANNAYQDAMKKGLGVDAAESAAEAAAKGMAVPVPASMPAPPAPVLKKVSNIDILDLDTNALAAKYTVKELQDAIDNPMMSPFGKSKLQAAIDHIQAPPAPALSYDLPSVKKSALGMNQIPVDDWDLGALQAALASTDGYVEPILEMKLKAAIAKKLNPPQFQQFAFADVMMSPQEIAAKYTAGDLQNALTVHPVMHSNAKDQIQKALSLHQGPVIVPPVAPQAATANPLVAAQQIKADIVSGMTAKPLAQKYTADQLQAAMDMLPAGSKDWNKAYYAKKYIDDGKVVKAPAPTPTAPAPTSTVTLEKQFADKWDNGATYKQLADEFTEAQLEALADTATDGFIKNAANSALHIKKSAVAPTLSVPGQQLKNQFDTLWDGGKINLAKAQNIYDEFELKLLLDTADSPAKKLLLQQALGKAPVPPAPSIIPPSIIPPATAAPVATPATKLVEIIQDISSGMTSKPLGQKYTLEQIEHAMGTMKSGSPPWNKLYGAKKYASPAPPPVAAPPQLSKTQLIMADLDTGMTSKPLGQKYTLQEIQSAMDTMPSGSPKWNKLYGAKKHAVSGPVNTPAAPTPVSVGTSIPTEAWKAGAAQFDAVDGLKSNKLVLKYNKVDLEAAAAAAKAQGYHEAAAQLEKAAKMKVTTQLPKEVHDIFKELQPGGSTTMLAQNYSELSLKQAKNFANKFEAKKLTSALNKKKAQASPGGSSYQPPSASNSPYASNVKPAEPTSYMTGGQAASKLQTDLNDYYTRLTTAERAAIKSYTGSGFDPMNNHLRKGQAASAATKGKINQVDRAMQKATPLEQPILVRRGTDDLTTKHFSSSAEKLEWLQNLEGSVIVDDAYASTSVGAGFQKSIRMRITVPKGTRGLWCDSRLSGFASTEKEFLLPRGTKFKVNKVTTVVEGWGQHITYVDCEVIP